MIYARNELNNCLSIIKKSPFLSFPFSFLSLSLSSHYASSFITRPHPPPHHPSFITHPPPIPTQGTVWGRLGAAVAYVECGGALLGTTERRIGMEMERMLRKKKNTTLLLNTKVWKITAIITLAHAHTKNTAIID